MKFPTVHLAKSVVNRIMNMGDEAKAMAMQHAPPVVPDPVRDGQSAALDNALATPPPAVPVPAGIEGDMASDLVQGGTAADVVGDVAALDVLP